MLVKILSNKWMSLFCTLVNSSFAFSAWNDGDPILASLCAILAWYCGWNFMNAVNKEDDND